MRAHFVQVLKDGWCLGACFFLIPILQIGCSGTDEAPPTTQPELLLAGPCRVYPIPAETRQRARANSSFAQLFQIFDHQLQSLIHQQSPFGARFVERSPESVASYDEAYQNWSGNGDLINRRFIPLNTYNQSNLSDLFQPLYTGQWNATTIRRASGIVFGGYKITPFISEQNCGIWSNLMGPYSHNLQKRNFQHMLENNQPFPARSFDLNHHFDWTSDSIFISTTRSVQVARHFAVHPGSAMMNEAYRDPSEQDTFIQVGYVYAILVHNGLDTFDRAAQVDPDSHLYEQEITVSGMIPWADVVGYRKMSIQPAPDAPPALIGPIFLRERLDTLEPAIANQIVSQLSRKSRETQDFEEGRDWRAASHSARLEYDIFCAQHPWQRDDTGI
jgi:hypothetical protein